MQPLTIIVYTPLTTNFIIGGIFSHALIRWGPQRPLAKICELHKDQFLSAALLDILCLELCSTFTKCWPLHFGLEKVPYIDFNSTLPGGPGAFYPHTFLGELLISSSGTWVNHLKTFWIIYNLC